MPKTYIEIDITADPSLTEQLVGLYSQLGVEGFWEDGPVLRCYISEERWSPALFEEFSAKARLVARSSSSTAPTFSLRTIAGRNWNEEWERTIKPIHVTDRIVITPTWHEYTPGAHELVLTIDPKMSFGTGYHETTRLVLRLMEKHVRPGMSLLDVGTGTGVLAIAGIKLGAHDAVAVDNDEWSYDNARENIRLNRVEDEVTVLRGELEAVPPRQFDMIVANIQHTVLEGLMQGMRQRLPTHGVLLLSGLLSPDRDPMVNALNTAGLDLVEELTENEWIALAARVASIVR